MIGRSSFAIACAALGACVTTTTTRPPPPPRTSAPPTAATPPAPPPPTTVEQGAAPAPTFQAVTPTPWLDLPLPDGVSPVVVEAGALATGAFVAGTHQVKGVTRRWVVRISAAGKMSAVDAGAGALSAAAAPNTGTDLLLAGGAWAGRVTTEGRVTSETALRVEAGGEINAVVPLEEGALLIGTHNPTASGESNGWLVAVDAAGKVRWEQRLGRGGYHQLWRATMDRRGHLLAVGTRKATTYQGWLVDVDKDGKLSGEQTDATRTWDALIGIAVGGDEELYVTGKLSPHQDADGAAVIMRRRSIGAETWRQQVLSGVIMVGPPVIHRRTVEFLVVTAKGDTGTLHLVRQSRDGGTPVVLAVGETFPLEWLALPAWIIGTTDADTAVAQVRRGADGGVEWRTLRLARPPVR